MLPYLLLTAGAFVTSFVSQRWRSRREKRGWNLADLACVAILVTFSGVRYGVGTDFYAYELAYARLDVTAHWWLQAEMYKQEIGYTILSLMVKSVSADPQAIFLVTSAIAIVPVYAALRKQSLDLSFAVTLYILLCFYVAPFNIIRQGLAFGLVFWGYSFIKKSKITFLLIGLLAATLHSTALLIVVVLLVGRLWKPKIGSGIFALALAVVAAGAIWTLPPIRQLLERLNDRYLDYLTADSSGLTVYLMIGIFLILAMLIGAYGSAGRPDWLAIVLIGIMFLIVSIQSPVALRMFNYFGLFVLLALPNALAGKKGGGAWKALVLIGAAIYFTVYASTFANLIPYQTLL